MIAVNMLEAKSNLSRLVQAIEDGKECEITIIRNGHPAARLVPISSMFSSQKIGLAQGLFEVPESIDIHKDDITKMFTDKK